MNAPIVRLFALVAVLYAALVGFTSRWTLFEADELRANPDNRRQLLEEQRIKRGLIRAGDGTVLARSVQAQGETYRRVYPEQGLFAHAVGYNEIDLGRSGLEQSRNDELTGERAELDSLLEQLRGDDREGDDVVTALDPGGQRTALQALQGRAGAVVALEPATGRVLTMASIPGYDANQVEADFARLRRAPGAPLLNRATQAGYPPGSTFKVVTAAAAIDSGAFKPDSQLDGSSPQEISGAPLRNFGGQSYGQVTLTQALTGSINTVWAQVGEQLGIGTMAEYMRRFGFYSKPPLDYPRDQLLASGAYPRGCSGTPLAPDSGQIDVGRMAIGQDKLCVTPLQMAMVAAAIANEGVLMEPRFTERIVDPDGRTREEIDPERQSRVISAESAAILTQMMGNVVREGTGTAAALAGIEVAGKTGTAEIDPARNINQPWFIGFAPIDNPRVAIAVTVERSTGQGGTVAAPIARQVMQALL